jgi:ABC-type multidrug transport system fused ATPase/permease subunit
LDTASEQIVQASLDRAKRGRTTVVIAHRLNTIKASDCIVVLGQLGHGASTDVDSAPLEPSGVLEQGTHQELLALKGAYHNLASKGGLVNALASERNAAPPGLLLPQP